MQQYLKSFISTTTKATSNIYLLLQALLDKKISIMNTIGYLCGLAMLCSVGLAVGYGTVVPTQNAYMAYPYMNNMAYGYAPYMGSGSFGGIGGFGAGGSGFGAGMGGMFGTLIYLFIFIVVINVLFSGNGVAGGGLGGLFGGKSGGKHATHY